MAKTRISIKRTIKPLSSRSAQVKTSVKVNGTTRTATKTVRI